MANRRNLIMDAPVNPAIMSGLKIIADTATVTATDKDIVLTFPAKTVLAVITSSSADTDAEKVEWTTETIDVVSTAVDAEQSPVA
jgi:hypothetical protein